MNPKREMANIQTKTKIYSPESIRRYAARLVAVIKPDCEEPGKPFSKKDIKKFWKIKAMFERTDVITNEELCKLQMMKERLGE